MLDLLSAFRAFVPQRPIEPAVAAAVILLGNAPPPMAANRIELALRAVAPHLTDAERAAWTTYLVESLAKSAITTPRCVAAFLGQCATESDGFRCIEENLSYSAARLCEVWPSRFPNLEAADVCALQPEVLANRVYANRMGNGDETSGDGWRFRGRGLLQISGRSTYERFAAAMKMTLDEATEHVATQAGAVDSAVWFWTENGLNTLASSWSVDLITRKINGGMTGAAERTRLCEAALQAIGV